MIAHGGAVATLPARPQEASVAIPLNGKVPGLARRAEIAEDLLIPQFLLSRQCGMGFAEYFSWLRFALPDLVRAGPEGGIRCGC